jgi:hypothetical protein
LSFSVSPEASTVPWSALFSWLVALSCAALAWRKRRTLDALEPPEVQRLLLQLTDDVATPEALDPVARRLAIAELNQRLGDVSFELGVLSATYTALTRISLASGSALALVGFLTSTGDAPVARAVRLAFAAFGGLTGAGTVAAIGRSAKTQAARIREKWDRSSREIGKALSAALAQPEFDADTR